MAPSVWSIADSNSNSDRDGDRDGDRDRNRNRDANSNRHGDSDCNCRGDSASNRYPRRHTHRDTNPEFPFGQHLHPHARGCGR